MYLCSIKLLTKELETVCSECQSKQFWYSLRIYPMQLVTHGEKRGLWLFFQWIPSGQTVGKTSGILSCTAAMTQNQSPATAGTTQRQNPLTKIWEINSPLCTPPPPTHTHHDYHPLHTKQARLHCAQDIYIYICTDITLQNIHVCRKRERVIMYQILDRLRLRQYNLHA